MLRSHVCACCRGHAEIPPSSHRDLVELTSRSHRAHIEISPAHIETCARCDSGLLFHPVLLEKLAKSDGRYSLDDYVEELRSLFGIESNLASWKSICAANLKKSDAKFKLYTSPRLTPRDVGLTQLHPTHPRPLVSMPSVRSVCGVQVPRVVRLRGREAGTVLVESAAPCTDFPARDVAHHLPQS